MPRTDRALEDPIRLVQELPGVGPQATDRNLDRLVAACSKRVQSNTRTNCRLSGQHRNPFESERRRRGRMSDPDLSYGDSKLLRFCIRSVAIRGSKGSSPISRRRKSAGRNWREAPRDEIVDRIMNGVVDRGGRKITKFVFRLCIAGKMWTARHLHGFARHKRSPVRPKPCGSFAGASGEKAEPMGRIKTWRAVARIGFDAFKKIAQPQVDPA